VTADAPSTGTRNTSASAPLTLIFAVLVLYLTSRGVGLRDEFILSPEHGLGYALGIIGGVMMLLLLLYPLRKHSRLLRHLGGVHHWFRLHMLLGILGPLAILFHCNFSLGAVNSNIALLCMALMVGSGLVGRYIYSRIHHGLYGHKTSLKELERDQQLAEELLASASGGLQPVAYALGELKAMQQYAQQPLMPLAACWRLLSISSRIRLLAWRLRRQLGNTPVPQRHYDYINSYIDCLLKMNGFTFFDRLFSQWHTLHMPIFFMLVITGFVHVWAVHRY
jgi:hypothetical protein